MTPTEKRIAIAEFEGWTKFIGTGGGTYWNDPKGVFVGGGSHMPLPDYLNDRDAIAAAVAKLRGRQKGRYAEALADILGYDDECYVNRPEVGDRMYHLNSYCMCQIAEATAAQRADALLITIGKLKLTQE